MTKTISGRSLPPILPREYCSIGRAARMLDCEVEDFLHWAEIGSIDLHLNVEIPSCVMTLNESERSEFLSIIEKQKSAAEEHDNDDTSHGIGLRIGLSYLWITESSLNDIGYDPDTELYHLELGVIQGLWAIEYSDLHLSLINKKETFTPWCFYVDTKVPPFFYVDTDSEIDYRVDQLQIVKSELEKLHFAITTGEPLKSRFNDVKLAGEMLKKESHRDRPTENNSPKKALALLSLSEYVLQKTELDPELINRADALQTAINRELVKNRIPEIEGEKTLYNAFQLAKSHRKKM